MELTTAEKKMAAALRAKRRAWKHFRWYRLGIGVLCGAAGVWLLVQVAYRAAASDRWDGELVWVAPVPWLLFIQGLALCVVTLYKWQGDPAIEMLLQLFEQMTHTEKGKGAGQ